MCPRRELRSRRRWPKRIGPRSCPRRPADTARDDISARRSASARRACAPGSMGRPPRFLSRAEASSAETASLTSRQPIPDQQPVSNSGRICRADAWRDRRRAGSSSAVIRPAVTRRASTACARRDGDVGRSTGGPTNLAANYRLEAAVRVRIIGETPLEPCDSVRCLRRDAPATVEICARRARVLMHDAR